MVWKKTRQVSQTADDPPRMGEDLFGGERLNEEEEKGREEGGGSVEEVASRACLRWSKDT